MGLTLLDELDADARLAGHYRLDAVRAHLLEMAGDDRAAIAQYQTAAGRTASEPERNYLMTQAARFRDSLGNLLRFPARKKFDTFDLNLSVINGGGWRRRDCEQRWPIFAEIAVRL